MSGIAGVVYTDRRPVDIATLDAMTRATPFLGVDGTQSWHDGPTGLVRFALKTTPHAVGEIQPFVDPRSGRVIVFDGRLDNRDALIDLLGSHSLGSAVSDCALLLAAHIRLGDAILDRLAGDYAFAIWDPVARRLFCARSPVGWRPLLWTFQGNCFGFATEPATLIRGLGLRRQLNEGAIGEHLSSRFVTDTDTFWLGVQRLPPGHALVLERGRIRTWCWHIGPFEDLSHLSDADHIERFCELLDQALVATTRSIGPVASHLSGGLDSSTIVCRIDALVKAGRIGQMVEPISVRFPGEVCDEGNWIAAVEAQCGIHTDSVFGGPFDPAVAAQWCSDTLHMPLRPNTAGTIVGVCDRLKERGVHVLLTGEGGDDWLNGSYGHWPDLLLHGRWQTLLREAMSNGATAGWAHGLRLIAGNAIAPLVSPRRRARVLRPHLDFHLTPPPWITPEWAQRAQLADRWRAAPLPPELPGFSQPQRYLVYALARRHVNVDNALAYAAMRGVELRHPFHDIRLTRFLMGAAGGMLRRDGHKKHLLREAMRGTLPESIRTRTSKANISAPIIDGVTTRLAERPIRDLQCVKMGWVDAAKLEKFQAAHVAWRQSGNADDVPMVPYAPVWNAIAVDLWLEHAFGG